MSHFLLSQPLDLELELERAVNTLRIRKQPPLDDPDYRTSMFHMLDAVEQAREEARGAVLQNKARVEQQIGGLS